MANNATPDYKSLFLHAEEGRKRAEDQRRHAEDQRRHAEDQRRQAEDRQKLTNFPEFIRHCHDVSRQLKVLDPSRSTTGTIPQPSGKYCPTRLERWAEFPVRHEEIYGRVLSHLQTGEADAQRLFPSLIALKEISRRLALRPIGSEQDLETYERLAVEDHVRDIITELCKIPAARDDFALGDGVKFDNHTRGMDQVEVMETDSGRRSNIPHPKPDQFCIHKIDSGSSALITTAEYKPPHKVPVEILRAGLRPMNLWQDMVKLKKIPTDGVEKSRYDAERLVCSAIVQEYHVMIQEGLEYGYLTIGLARVVLRVLHKDPSTLYYYLCDHDRDIDWDDQHNSRNPLTAVTSTLCLCLMGFSSRTRTQEWRNAARSQLHIWKTSFDLVRSEIPSIELRQSLSSPSTTESDNVSPDISSDYQPSSSPHQLPAATTRRAATRSQAGCAPSESHQRSDSPDLSDSDGDEVGPQSKKRTFSQLQSSPSPEAELRKGGLPVDGQSRNHDAQFCTQRCLLGLQNVGTLDDRCPNVELHRRGGDGTVHPINADELIRLLKRQLDGNLDENFTPFGKRGTYGAPFKLTCAAHGYTVVGKGTTSEAWKEVSREESVYRALRKAQASATTIFLGTIDLAKVYFLHGVGDIRHMLVMAWGGETLASLKHWPKHKIRESVKLIHSFGVIHQDLRPENVLWNQELERVLIIDLHQAKFDVSHKPKYQSGKRRQGYDGKQPLKKRLRVL